MADILPKRTPQTIADERVTQILRAADSWAAEVPAALTPSVRAVCIRLAEMIADADCTPQRLRERIDAIMGDPARRAAMAAAAREVARPDAADRIADLIEAMARR